VLNLILRLRENTTIFMSSHNLADIERVCDMVGIVEQRQTDHRFHHRRAAKEIRPFHF